MKKENERTSLFQRLRERSERFDNLCEWLADHWEDVVLYSLGTIITVLIILFVLIVCNACSQCDQFA